MIDKRGDRAIPPDPHHRAKFEDFRFPYPLELRKGRDGGIQFAKRGEFLLPRMDENGPGVAERDVREAVRRIIDELAAREGQRPHKGVTERVVKHRRASSRRMVTELPFSFENDDFGVRRKHRCGRQAGYAPADDEDVRVQEDASLLLTILPSRVTRIA